MTTKAKKDYSKGKIYKIEPICDHDEHEIYIGSTTKEYLSQRMVGHRQDYTLKKRKTTAFKLFDKYGIENCNIILLESVNANNYNELVAREAHYIKTLKCVNKVIPLRTDREYYDDNRDYCIQYEKNYRAKNAEKIKERKKIYCQLVYNCDCGSVCRVNVKAVHFKTKKHQTYLKTL
jgi:ribosome-interacting GTPase 1